MIRGANTIAQANAPFDSGNLRHNSIRSYPIQGGWNTVQMYNVAWYGTLLNERNYRRRDTGKTTKGWWTQDTYHRLEQFINGALNNNFNDLQLAKRTVKSTLDVNLEARKEVFTQNRAGLGV